MTTRRRTLFAGAIAICAPFSSTSLAQKSKPSKVGVISIGSSETSGPLVDGFAQELHKLGYIEGRDIVIERRFADGNIDRIPELLSGLERLKVDVIVLPGNSAGLVAKRTIKSIPIVLATSSDPVESGLVTSLARPGGNITGMSSMARDLVAKRLELLKQLSTNPIRLAVVAGPDTVAARLSEIQASAGQFGMDVSIFEVRQLEDLESTETRIRSWRATALLVADSSWNFRHRNRLVALASKLKIPSMYAASQYVDAGGLLSYGANFETLWRHAATFVDRILKGAKPADLPVEQATKFDLAINLKTATALGIKVPQTVLLQATQVIQ